MDLRDCPLWAHPRSVARLTLRDARKGVPRIGHSALKELDVDNMKNRTDAVVPVWFFRAVVECWERNQGTLTLNTIIALYQEAMLAPADHCAYDIIREVAHKLAM